MCCDDGGCCREDILLVDDAHMPCCCGCTCAEQGRQAEVKVANRRTTSALLPIKEKDV